MQLQKIILHCYTQQDVLTPLCTGSLNFSTCSLKLFCGWRVHNTQALPTGTMYFVEATLQRPLVKFSAQCEYALPLFPTCLCFHLKLLSTVNYCVWFGSLDLRLLHPPSKILMLQCQCCTTNMDVSINVGHSIKSFRHFTHLIAYTSSVVCKYRHVQ